MAFNKIKITVAAGLLLLSTSTIASAKTQGPPAPAAVKAATPANTPELTAADERVNQTKAQLETAKKQLEATKVLLKAAEADFKAAKAEREALALKTQAQSLADASGVQPARAGKVPPVANNGMKRIDSGSAADFNSTATNNAAEPMQLR